ncbi:MAG: hypothetical protein Q8J67_00485 [Rhodocyclaceae bacterium]|jgi:hypothetical protein|nr:hypothetical protein [Rhodocyclaceae bacterium]
MKIEIVGEITHVETIAQGNGIRDLALLRSQHGVGSWRKRKGVAQLKLPNGSIVAAEIHWYEAHGIGKVKLKIKEWL